MFEKYQTMSDVEHVIKKSGMYIGNTNKKESEEWILDKESNQIIKKKLFYSSGLLKIFDEIISNTQDVFNKYNNQVKNVVISIKDDSISVMNDGPTIPIEKMEDDNETYIITSMFGSLRSSSNYDNEQVETIGTFGIGAKATNIFSKYFKVQCYDSNKGQLFTQTWYDNMSRVSEPKIKPISKKKSFTNITFIPDLEKFETNSLKGDIYLMFKKRAIDLAAICNGLIVNFDDERFVFKTTLEYINLYFDGDIIFENGTNYNFGIICDVKEGDHVSFVNGNLTKNGIHITTFLNILTKMIKEKLEKKKIKTNLSISNLIKQKIFLFISCKVKNAKYGSQTKENLIDGDIPKFSLSTKTINKLVKAGFVKDIIDHIVNKEKKDILKKVGKKSNTKSFVKLDEAQMAGTKESHKCTLILTEGDSAKTVAICGLKIIGRKYYGVFPLKGKLLNTRNASNKQILANTEIKALISIIGLDINKKHQDTSSLRYGRVMLMTDQDQDGSHIKGLIINFIHSYWPELVKTNFFYEFITPIIKATKGKEVIEFFNVSDFHKWHDLNKKKNYFIKYYKGLGTSTDKEAESYFKNYDKHVINFTYNENDDEHILKAFDKKLINKRKEWLKEFMVNKKGCTEDLILYNRDNSSNNITYGDFINKELIHFSNADNIRSIPNIVDGFKPGQRKIMHVVFNMKFSQKSEIKVEQLAGHVSANSAYHHGEDSLKLTIVNLANNYVGSNNINFLNPIGQYGSRLQGGKDRSSPRYIYTNLLPITRKIFIKEDEYVLDYLKEENQSIEPKYFVPIIPTLLVNGARGIGTGWSTNIPCFNPLDIIDYLLSIIENSNFEENDIIMPEKTFEPWYHNFTGQIYKIDPFLFIVTGNVNVNIKQKSVIISELPIGLWTENFKKRILEDEEIDIKELSTKDDATFLIIFKNRNLFDELLNKENGLYIYFRIISRIKTSNLVAFDTNCSLKEYQDIKEIIKDFVLVRLETYKKRKSFLLNKIKKELTKLRNKCRFIKQIVSEEIEIFKKPKKTIVSILENNGYDIDPDQEDLTENNKYDYLIKMSIESFTNEKIDELSLKRDNKEKELIELEDTSIENIWKTELEELKNYYVSTTKNKRRRTYENFNFVKFVSSKDINIDGSIFLENETEAES